MHFMTNREFKKLLLMMMMMMMIKVVKHLSTTPLSPIGDMWVQLQSFILGT
jgi:guanylate kinase